MLIIYWKKSPFTRKTDQVPREQRGQQNKSEWKENNPYIRAKQYMNYTKAKKKSIFSQILKNEQGNMKNIKAKKKKKGNSFK